MRRLVAMAMVWVWAATAGAGPKYVFLFIGDGMSLPQRAVAAEYLRQTGQGTLAINSLPVQGITATRSANTDVTDSAAAATAIACGEKTKKGQLGVAADGRRLVSVAEAFHAAGRKVGILTTVPVTHATPAGFYAHQTNRRHAAAIVGDLVASRFEFFGGGSPELDAATRREALARMVAAGYRVVENSADFAALKPGEERVVAITPCDQTVALDRPAEERDFLARRTAKAVELLAGPQGFFLMVEGGHIDWTCHANDAAAMVNEVLAFDAAVRVALDFQRKHPEDTLVVVTGDHETGALTLGAGGSHVNLAPLANQRTSAAGFRHRFEQLGAEAGEVDPESAWALIESSFGLRRTGAADDAMVLKAEEGELLAAALEADRGNSAAGDLRPESYYDANRSSQVASTCLKFLSERCGLKWSSQRHSALPVVTSASGCGAERFGGWLENGELGRRLKALAE